MERHICEFIVESPQVDLMQYLQAGLLVFVIGHVVFSAVTTAMNVDVYYICIVQRLCGVPAQRICQKWFGDPQGYQCGYLQGIIIATRLMEDRPRCSMAHNVFGHSLKSFGLRLVHRGIVQH